MPQLHVKRWKFYDIEKTTNPTATQLWNIINVLKTIQKYHQTITNMKLDQTIGTNKIWNHMANIYQVKCYVTMHPFLPETIEQIFNWIKNIWLKISNSAILLDNSAKLIKNYRNNQSTIYSNIPNSSEQLENNFRNLVNLIKQYKECYKIITGNMMEFKHINRNSSKIQINSKMSDEMKKDTIKLVNFPIEKTSLSLYIFIKNYIYIF